MYNPAHPRQPELVALTSLRGIAALFVLSHHFMYVLLEKLPRAIPSHLFHKSYLWVDLFFMLSGFVLAYVYQLRFESSISKQDYRKFMWSRFARIYPLHFFILLLFLLFEFFQWYLISSGAPNAERLDMPFIGSDSVFTFVTNLFLVQTFHWEAYWNQPAWSISAEWLIYFTVPCLILKFHHANKVMMAVSAAIIFSVLASVEGYFGNLGLDYAGWPMLLRCFGECVLGVIAYHCYRNGDWQKFAAARWTLAALVFNVFLLALPIPGIFSVAGFFWLVLCAARIPEGKNYLLTWAPLVYLGKISFSVYMFHWLLLNILRAGSQYFTGKPLPQNLSLAGEFGVFFGATLVVLCIAPLLYHFVETPLRNKLLARVL